MNVHLCISRVLSSNKIIITIRHHHQKKSREMDTEEIRLSNSTSTTTVSEDVTTFRDYTLDDSLYSRQRYVLGDYAMNKLTKGGNVFLSGLGGVGVEIAKNLVLAGIKSLTLHDTINASPYDLSTQFYINPSNTKVDAGANRATLSIEKISELNPYVKVSQSTLLFQDIITNLDYLLQFKCIILTECPLEYQIKINEYCRQHSIYFLVCDSFGLFGWVFNDFGQDFLVHDKNGEDIKETFISSISIDKEAIVTCMENQMHNLESGDLVLFREVKGMTEINGTKHKVNVINPYSFSIGDTSTFSHYQSGGIISDIKTPITINFKSLKESIETPDILDFDFMKNNYQLHLARQTIQTWFEAHSSTLPKAWNQQDANDFIQLAININEKLKTVEEIDKTLFEKIAFTCLGKICPLTSVLGAFTAQEALKSITGKFTPLKQWLYVDCYELFPKQEEKVAMINHYSIPNTSIKITTNLLSDRSLAQHICLGQETCEKLENTKLFMIGSGAIGCEMLKNYALLGVACGSNGRITITDNDLIEKSNLNRQFLFRNTDINNPKSKVASLSVTKMNEKINIDAHQNKVEMASENIYNSEFLDQQDVVVSALDNVEARLYVDTRCVQHSLPLLESGTLGTKGHTQVILPAKTESYASQKDPVEKQTPFCTLKSFPNNLSHCIQWSRDKFEKLFSINIQELDKFINDSDYLNKLLNSQANNKIAICKSLSKLIQIYPTSFKDCVVYSRLKFEKLFNHNALQLLHSYPMDLKTKEGTPFWTLPKRPPVAVQFDRNDDTHINFIKETTALWANIFNITIPSNPSKELIGKICLTVKVPKFEAKKKAIVSDEKAAAPIESFSYEQFIELTKKLAKQLEELKKDKLQDMMTDTSSPTLVSLYPQSFEKDDDSNHHIDFITATSNLRARIYSIEEGDRFKVKLVAGKIIPAIATTTSVVSGLVAIELVKIIRGDLPLDQFKCTYLNLSLPIFSVTEPGPAPTVKLTPSISYNLWDRWAIKDNPNITVQDLIQLINDKYGLMISGIYQNSLLVFMSALPFHKTRLSMKLRDLLTDLDNQKFIDLYVLFKNENNIPQDTTTSISPDNVNNNVVKPRKLFYHNQTTTFLQKRCEKIDRDVQH
ncbi:hypothetical protein DFA_03010 [Cavenderia fasciculata]|uniref:E1 ubiquitin-activating enzyme n=1 Tax=Cavenderia fasciculata TaxID=261658 RepID=F4PGD2_CACFS|nr:uncharacterized protein DFA_03010 [Cavenderia fasciculata]EGG24766.1 hypothetical protein DFA_03010 [Cavenderia fasciculata]|eukprot:XP_004362617.1 hypothetical protein DFA_03010 [Cavenderia fasciculata]